MKCKLILLFLSFALPGFSNGNIDSLINSLGKVSGENKIKTYLDLSDALKYSEPQTAIQFAEDGLMLSRKEKQPEWESKFYTNLGVLYSIQTNYEKSDSFYQKAIVLYRQLNNAKGIGKAYCNMAVNFQERGLFKEAVEYYNKSIVIFETLSDSNLVFLVKLNVANVDYRQGYFDRADSLYHHLLVIAKSKDDQSSIAKITSNIGRVQLNKGNYPKALQIFYQVGELYDSLDNKYHKANLLNDIGTIYKNLDMFDKALSTFKEGIAGFQNIKNQRGVGMIQANMADCFIEKEQFDTAYYLISNALEIYDRLEVKSNGDLLISLGKILMHYNKLDSAELIFEKALEVGTSLNKQDGIAAANLHLGMFYMELNELEKAKRYLLDAQEILEISEELELLEINTRLLANLYEKQNDFQKAIYYKNLSADIEDRLFGKEKMNQIHKLEIEQFLKTTRQDTAVSTFVKTNKTSGWTKLTYLIVILAGFFFIWLVAKKSKKQKTFSEIDKGNNNKLNLEKDLEKKNLELTFLSLSMIHKDKFLQKLKLNLEKIAKNDPGNKAIRELIQSIRLNDVNEKNWENFKKVFSQVFPNFFDELYNRHQQLTTKELRHCALIRLKIPPHDSAQIMGISIDSVHKARYRLRKKFGLKQKDKLEEFLLNLTAEV